MAPWLISSPHWIADVFLLALLGLAVGLYRKSWITVLALIPFALTLVTVQQRLLDRLPADQAGREVWVTGRVDGLPVRHDDMLEFLLRTDLNDAVPVGLPKRIRVRWYDSDTEVHSGQTWKLPLRLQPPWGRVNFQGPDAERRYFSRQIGALGTVRAGNAEFLQQVHRASLTTWREALRERLSRRLADEPAVALILTLAVADRSRLSPEQWRVFSGTGTGHLLAISGLHIGFAALLGYRLSWLLMLPVGSRWRMRLGPLPGWIGALAVASLYAALAGFAISTQRALLMLTGLSLAVLSKRNPGPWLAWSMALGGVVLYRPAAPLEPGFWLSFGAVSVLIMTLSPRVGHGGVVRVRLLAQFAVALVMLPLGMYWFQRASALGVIANLFAIPAVSLLIVPIVLLGVVAVSLGWFSVAGALLLPAAWLADGLFRALSWLASQGEALQWTTAAVTFTVALLVGIAGLCVLGPAGWKGRLLGPLLALGGFSVSGLQPAPGELRLDLLDVGQGLAALVTTQDSALLYDSGPGQPGQWDLVDSVILPAMRANGHAAPSRIMIGHGDLDHAGGLSSLQTRFPHTPVWLNAADSRMGTHSCNTPLKWTDAVARYSVWHPSSYLPYLGNLSSCVLSVRTQDHALLLPGDIDRVVERRLIAEGLGPHEVLVAPHHGSRTSSDSAFLDALRPRWILIPAGIGNRFGFPHPEIRQRYEAMGMYSASVSDCGALQLRLGPGGAAVLRSARTRRAALWRWPAAESCP